jgi:hypothetical protein
MELGTHRTFRRFEIGTGFVIHPVFMTPCIFRPRHSRGLFSLISRTAPYACRRNRKPRWLRVSGALNATHLRKLDVEEKKDLGSAFVQRNSKTVFRFRQNAGEILEGGTDTSERNRRPGTAFRRSGRHSTSPGYSGYDCRPSPAAPARGFLLPTKIARARRRFQSVLLVRFSL